MNKFYALTACLLVFCLGMFAGVRFLAPALTAHHYTERVIERPAEVKETIRHEVETIVKYVPKEVIVYKDTVTGIETVQKELTDVEANIKPPAINVSVNGQPYSFSLLQGEEQKFDDGKVVLNQTSDIGIELTVKPQVIDKTKHNSIDFVFGKYSGVSIKHKRIGFDATVNIFDKKDIMIQGRYTVAQW